VGAFPIHVWTLILFFRDFSWLTARTNSWDAIGVGAYGLLIAFLESFMIFLVGVGLRFLIPVHWKETQWVTAVGVLIFFCVVWSFSGQLYFLLNITIPISVLNYLASRTHPLRYLYGIVIALIGSSLFLPMYFIMISQKFRFALYNLIDRVTLLTTLYLILDMLSIVVIVSRNIG
jgi:hypothetical protein